MNISKEMNAVLQSSHTPFLEIGSDYAEIFDEVIRINTLDAKLYEQVQQTMIDALDQGEMSVILGKRRESDRYACRTVPAERSGKRNDLFENCVADVNIPVGEVFTSPVLDGTNGVLNVSKVYLDGLQYRNLKLTFKDGKITDYTVTTFRRSREPEIYL